MHAKFRTVWLSGALAVVPAASAQWTQPPSADDDLDVSTGALVADFTAGIAPGPEAAIGADLGGAEPGTCFCPDVGLGGICFIEVDTDPISLGAARLYAKNDGIAAFFRRAMQGFKLLADTDGDGVFETTLVDKEIDPDYDLEPDNLATQSEYLELAFEFAPVTSSAWRLEFEQGASVPPFEGMRIIEVDGFGAGACYPDCDGSGALDFFDFLCFQNAFAIGDPYADCDGTGALDFFDFLCFQNEFAAGCS